MEISHPLQPVSSFLLRLPAEGTQVLNSRTLGKVSRPRLLLSVFLSPEVDSHFCSKTGGLTFDLPWTQGTVFTDCTTLSIWENEIKEHTRGFQLRKIKWQFYIFSRINIFLVSYLLPLKLCLFLCPLFVSFRKWKFIRNSILSITALGITPSKYNEHLNVADIQSAQILWIKMMTSRQNGWFVTE